MVLTMHDEYGWSACCIDPHGGCAQLPAEWPISESVPLMHSAVDNAAYPLLETHSGLRTLRK